MSKGVSWARADAAIKAMGKSKSPAFGKWVVPGGDGSEALPGVVRNLKREAPPASGHVNSVTSATIILEGKPRRRRAPRMYKSDGPVRYCRTCMKLVSLGHGSHDGRF